MNRVGGFWEEFKRFAIKGNALDLAVAVVVGNAFSGIVNSLVTNIITPLIGLMSPGNTDFKNAAVTLRPGYTTANGIIVPPLQLGYGAFFSAIFNFLVISLSIFFFFKLFSVMRRRFFVRHEEEVTPPHEKPAEERLLEEIRDLLKEQQEKK